MTQSPAPVHLLDLARVRARYEPDPDLSRAARSIGTPTACRVLGSDDPPRPLTDLGELLQEHLADLVAGEVYAVAITNQASSGEHPGWHVYGRRCVRAAAPDHRVLEAALELPAGHRVVDAVTLSSVGADGCRSYLATVARRPPRDGWVFITLAGD